jgi:preprotein translocase subunit SecF
MFFVEHRTIFFTLIGVLTAGAILALAVFGLRFSIDFTGGTLVEFHYDSASVQGALEKEQIESALHALGHTGFSLREAGDGYLLRMKTISEEEFTALKDQALASGDAGALVVDRRATVGPSIGSELTKKAYTAIAVVSLLIIVYVAFAFRKKTELDEEGRPVYREEDEEEKPPVSSWTYGGVAIFVLIHDMLIPLGFVAVFGASLGIEVDVLIVMALLTILGYSVNDTIVIFDRIRENLEKNATEGTEEAFAHTVGRSLSQTYTRSIYTSFTTLLVVGALFVLGGPTTTWFALVLALGVLVGTYSSLALAAPLLIAIHAYIERKKSALPSSSLKTS